MSWHEAHGGSAQPIRRETFEVETLKSRSTLEEDIRSVVTPGDLLAPEHSSKGKLRSGIP
jgi:hypothetical protein